MLSSHAAAELATVTTVSRYPPPPALSYKAMSNISFLDIRVPVASLEGNLAHWENIIRSKSQAAAAPPKPTAGSPRASSTRSISASKASGDHDDAKDATPDKRD